MFNIAIVLSRQFWWEEDVVDDVVQTLRGIHVYRCGCCKANRQIGSAPLEAFDRFIWRQGWYIVTIINVTETSPAFRSATFDDANNIYQQWTQSGVTIPRMPFRLTKVDGQN